MTSRMTFDEDDEGTRPEEELSEDRLLEYREAFSLFDKDGDGTITGKELQTVMRSLGMSLSDDQLRSMLKNMGANENGDITFKEFLVIMRSIMGEEGSQDEVKKAFKSFDEDGDGVLGFEDLKRTMTKLGETMTDAELREMIRMADLDQDGFVNFKEFTKILDSLS